MVTENRGYRVVKFDGAGTQQWSLGQAGVWGDDNAHFGSDWATLEGNPAVDALGRIYVPDTGNNRIQILSADGDYLATFGSYGTGPYQFLCPTAVAINPGTGDIHVADHCNHRVQVFTKDRVYKATWACLANRAVTMRTSTRYGRGR